MLFDKDIQNWYVELEALCFDIPGAFIFNVDETGCCDWVDAHDVKVLVPSSYSEDKIKIPVDRNSKRATLVGCISADGTVMKPMILLSRKTIEGDIFLSGYNESNVLFAHQKNGFMTASLFEFWAENIFFEEIERKRVQYNYQGPALLLLDGLKCHCSDKFLVECQDRNIYTLFLVPHSSDRCQPLDLVTFGILKKNYSKMTFKRYETKQSNQIAKILGAWYQVSAPHLVVSAFMALGMTQYKQNNMIYWNVDIKKNQKLRTFQYNQEMPIFINNYLPPYHIICQKRNY